MHIRLLATATVTAAALHLGADGVQKPLFSNPKGLSNLELDMPLDAQSAASCAVCEATLLQMKLAAARGDDFFVSVTTSACKRLKIADDDVCEGSVALEGPILAHSLRGLSLGSRTSRLICVALFGRCAFPDVEEFDVPFPSPKPKRRRPKPSGQEPLHVVHYSDIHIDPWYTEGADANCTKFICCRNYADGPAPGDAVLPARPNGEHTCDSPISLEQSMYKAIGELVPDAVFSIFTGDIVDHAVWNTTIIENSIDVRNAYDRMDDAGMLVYGTAGNHEASPANSYPPLEVSDTTQWLYNVLSVSWNRWIGPDAASKAREFGAYSAKHPDRNIRVISLSTNLYYVHNYWLYQDPMDKDPSGQLTWLVGELDAAEKAGERVYIMGHMAPGARDAFHDVSNYFDQIVNRYEATIAALFFGHTHLDEFEIFYSNYSQQTAENAIAVAYIAPSMTPTSGHPAFRVYDIDPVTFGVLDITTYIANMSDSAFQSAEGPVWTKYYSAREAYGSLISPPVAPPEIVDHVSEIGTRELDPAFWHEVTAIFEGNPTAFNDFMTRRRRGWEPEDCVDDCKSAEICKLRAGRAQNNCIVPGAIRLRPRTRDIPTTNLAERECEGSVLADTLGTLAGDPDMRMWLERLIQSDVEL
ncbi:Metallo-dependent phosphatase-like protein [Astrocystis sublimbata]|nr:Metallo-dependent phosphatase-like protein [Astrocystis sublimbata]